MPESAPLPALPTPRGVRQASMMSASIIGIILLLNGWKRFESAGEGGQWALRDPPPPALSTRAKLVALPQERGEGEQSNPRCVLRDHVAIEAGAEFRRTQLRIEIDVVEPKALVEPKYPFEIVHQAPEEIAAHRHAFGGGALELGQVVAQIHDAVGFVDLAVGRHDVVAGGAVLADINRVRFPDLCRQLGHPV